MRPIRKRLGILGLICSLMLVGMQTNAAAETFTNAAEMCAGWLVGHPTQTSFCTQVFGFAAATQLNQSVDAAQGALLDAQTTVETTDATKVQAVSALISEALGQVEQLTQLRVYFDLGADDGGAFVEAGVFNNGSQVVYTERRVGSCLPTCIVSQSSESSPSGFSTSKFTWVFDAKAYWDPDREGSCGCANGIAVWNLYRASPQFHSAFDFYALGMWSSVSPQSGFRFKRLLQQIKPYTNPEIIEASPRELNEYGDAGSLTVGVDLGAQTGSPGGAASFSISRTWNYSKGIVGGRVASSELHEADWATTSKSGETLSKSTTGATTWKVPKKKAAKWGAAAAVHYVD